jgi:hypothetical protein
MPVFRGKSFLKGQMIIGEFFELGNKSNIVFSKTSKGTFRSVTEGRTWTKIR